MHFTEMSIANMQNLCYHFLSYGVAIVCAGTVLGVPPGMNELVHFLSRFLLVILRIVWTIIRVVYLLSYIERFRQWLSVTLGEQYRVSPAPLVTGRANYR